jgi:hypothetical protein
MTLLIDFTSVTCQCTDHALEAMYKSMSEPPGDDIWTPHHDPYVSDHIEEVTARLLMSLHGAIRCVIDHATTRDRHFTKTDRPDLPSGAWNPDQVDAVRIYLQSKSADQYTVDDWLLLADWSVQQFLSPQKASDEAEFLAIRSWMAGKVQAEFERRSISKDKARIAMAATPRTIKGFAPMATGPTEIDLVEVAIARSATLIQGVGDDARKVIREEVVSYAHGKIIGDPSSTTAYLEQRLRDKSESLGRDFRRIAITETATNANEAFVASMPFGAIIRRMEYYSTACGFCRAIHGKDFEVVDPALSDKNDRTQIWLGKDNVGRSAAPRKRVGDELVKRTESEMWRPTSGPIHPHCRGTWVRVPGIKPIKKNPAIARMIDDATKS